VRRKTGALPAGASSLLPSQMWADVPDHLREGQPRSGFTFNLRSRFWFEGQTEEIPDLSTLLLASLLALRTRKLRPW